MNSQTPQNRTMNKTKLQEMCVRKSWTFPRYSAVKDGPDHNPRFRATVSVNGAVFDSSASCKSVKEAHDKVAEAALIYFTSISSSSCLTNSPSPGDVKVPMKKPELQKQQEENESNIVVKSCNLKYVGSKLERENEAVDLDMNSLSLKQSSQDSGPKLAKGGASVSKTNGKANSTKFDGSLCDKGKGKLMNENSYTTAETLVDLKTPNDPEESSFLLCNRVKVYSYVPDIATLPKGVTLMQICDDMWVAVSLDFPNEKAF